MKRKWVFIVIGLLLVAGIGGKVYMDKRAEQKEAGKIEVERMSVVALKNTFADIKSVEIEESKYNVMTGSYLMFARMTNQNNVTVVFSYTFEKDENEVGYIVEDKEIQSEGLTTEQIQVIYSNGEEGEI